MMRGLERFLRYPEHTLPTVPPPRPEKWGSFMRGVAKDLSQMPAVKADAAWRWYWQTENPWIMEDDPDQFGRLRLPFPRMVIEGRTPSTLWASNTGWLHNQPRFESVVLLQEHPAADGYEIAAIVFVAIQGQVYTSPTIALVATDLEGRLISREMKGQDRFVHYVTPGTHFDPWLEDDSILDHVRPALLAVALMHCRNTQLVKDKVSERVRRKREKTGKPTVEWRTIQVPGPNSQSDRLTSNNAGAVVPFHVVRGHFKTYTEEAPLFGSITGTYWWSSHGRGDIGAGERRHKYVVRSGKHETT